MVEIDIKVLMEVGEENLPTSFLDEEILTEIIEDLQRSTLMDLLPEGAIVELDVVVGGLECE